MTHKAKGAMTRYRLISYDVWGNVRDGFDVNQAFRTDTVIEIPDDADDVAIIRILKDEGLIKKRLRFASVEIDASCDGVIYVNDARNGRPEFELQREDAQ